MLPCYSSIRKNLMLRSLTAIFVITFGIAFSHSSAALENVIADLSIDHISIDYNFSGIDLAIFGVAAQNQNIAIIAHGPHKPFIIRKKGSFWGIWANKQNITIEKAPAFYSLLSSHCIENTNQKLLEQLEIGVDNINLDTNAIKNKEFVDNFRQINKKNKMYQEYIGTISFVDNTLFKATINFPDKTPAGRYIISIFSIKDNKILSAQIMPISIENKGLNALVQKLAYKYSAFYSILVILVALIVGWTANILFKKK
ncbi:hypothetical protein RLOatenuis_3640 [Rickettsiales bacterium]|nr:hypothetical protein RLOatenuis_3640 [Rickettsiales bacterium]